MRAEHRRVSGFSIVGLAEIEFAGPRLAIGETNPTGNVRPRSWRTNSTVHRGEPPAHWFSSRRKAGAAGSARTPRPGWPRPGIVPPNPRGGEAASGEKPGRSLAPASLFAPTSR